MHFFFFTFFIYICLVASFWVCEKGLVSEGCGICCFATENAYFTKITVYYIQKVLNINTETNIFQFLFKTIS